MFCYRAAKVVAYESLRVNRSSLYSVFYACRYSSDVNARLVKENNPYPEYPPILDMSEEAVQRRERQKWYDKIQRLGTVEEKLFEINLPRYYGWESLLLEEGVGILYNSLPFSKYMTRTHFYNNLPDRYRGLSDTEEKTVNTWMEKVKSHVQDALLFEYNFKRYATLSNMSDKLYFRDSSY